MNNMFIVDPSRIEIADLKRPEPGKIIRLKRNAIGTDVRQALQQLQVADVTAQHITNLPIFIRVGDSIAAVNDTLRGQSQSGGRKTATEVRGTGEANLSRLSAHAQVYSSQGVCDLGYQQSMNIQQFMSIPKLVELNGQSQRVTAVDLQGEYLFPIHDGTLPLDKGGMLQTFSNLIQLILKDPQLRQQTDVMKMVDFAAQLGGMLNFNSFRLSSPQVTQAIGGPGAQIQPPIIAQDHKVEQQFQRGNIVPIGQP